MNSNEAVVIVVLILAVVTVVALFRFNKDFRAIVKALGVSFSIAIKGKDRFPREKQLRSGKKIKPVGELENSQPWLFHHWRAVVITSVVLLLIVMPFCWWFEQPATWRMLAADEFNELVKLLRHGSHGPWNVPRGRATLNNVTRVVEMRADSLKQSYQDEDIWIVDHFWQYWNTDTLKEYVSVNKMFVAKGGRIHRMFFLTKEELQNPEVQAMLQAQCGIGRLGEDQTGNGFELWRADPDAIKSREEYETIARQFRQLPYTGKSFEDFDIMQFNDVLYYSSDFSRDYRVMGSSTWIFNPEDVSKIDLRPLFKKSIAEKISCDHDFRQTAMQQATGVSAIRKLHIR